MDLFVWKDAYSVNVQQFDSQHQQLFKLIEELSEAMSLGEGRLIVRQVVGQLAHYTRVHFKEEEEILRRTGYPGLAAHQLEHQRFVADVERMGRDIDRTGNTNTVAVLGTLRDWLVNHIQKTDRLYSRHLNAQGIE